MQMTNEYSDLEPEQPNMIDISVGAREYKVTVAKTEKAREQGLQEISSLPYDQGMLFVFDAPTQASFWMKDTYISLDIIYISEDGEVLQVFSNCQPLDETPHVADNADVLYVLEVNSGSGIQVDDEVDLSDLWDDESEEVNDGENGTSDLPKMLVLNAKGGTQMELKGGERIFSRPNTKTLIRIAKRAYKSKDSKDYKALGKRVFKYLHIQDHKQDDYVELPAKE